MVGHFSTPISLLSGSFLHADSHQVFGSRCRMRVSMMISESRRIARPSYLWPAIVSVSSKHHRTVRAVHVRHGIDAPRNSKAPRPFR